jgi:thymidylate synthase ThyX
MAYEAKVIADSISPENVRLTTIEVTLPRIVLAEFNTHRMFSRNSASSRAIPVERRIQMIESDPFVPTAFGKNQKGMQAGEALEGEAEVRARLAWYNALNASVVQARELAKIGVHKQLANRLLEPFAWHTIVVTATEWENFFALRCHPNAQPEIRTAAEMMRDAMRASEPVPIGYDEWHLPYLKTGEAFDLDVFDEGWKQACGASKRDVGPYTPAKVKVSVARCARVSFLTHDGVRDTEADRGLYDKLAGNGHMSPLEHAARPATSRDIGMAMASAAELGVSIGYDIIGNPDKLWFGNFKGWVQHRKLVAGESVFVEPKVQS